MLSTYNLLQIVWAKIRPDPATKCLRFKLLTLFFCLKSIGLDKQLEDLTVLKRSPDLLNNVKIGQDQLLLIMKHILFLGVAAILVK